MGLLSKYHKENVQNAYTEYDSIFKSSWREMKAGNKNARHDDSRAQPIRSHASDVAPASFRSPASSRRCCVACRGKMAAVHDGPSDMENEKETKPDILSDESAANLPGMMSGTLPTSSPLAPPAAAAPKAEEQQQTLLAVLQFLKRNNLTESVEILRREAGLQDELEEARGTEATAPGLNAGTGDTSSLLSRVTSHQSAAPAKGALQTHDRIPDGSHWSM